MLFYQPHMLFCQACSFIHSRQLHYFKLISIFFFVNVIPLFFLLQSFFFDYAIGPVGSFVIRTSIWVAMWCLFSKGFGGDEFWLFWHFFNGLRYQNDAFQCCKCPMLLRKSISDICTDRNRGRSDIFSERCVKTRCSLLRAHGYRCRYIIVVLVGLEMMSWCSPPVV